MNKINKLFGLDGKIAVVTGGATGLGLAITKSFIDAGARVVILSRHADKEIIDSFNGKAIFYPFDVTNTKETPKMVDKIIKEIGDVSILVNNAGNHCKKPIEEMSVEDFSSVLDVHLVGAFALTKAFVPHMKKLGEASIIFQASMTSYIGQPYVAGYSTAKAGYLGLVHTLASECGPFGVRVNAIAPGWIETPMFHQATDNDAPRLNKILGRIPMSKVGSPEDIGNACIYLSSKAASYINGICLPVDGGALIGF
jgi:gluconate 5-dehydrogenase